MNNIKTAIFVISESSIPMAQLISRELSESVVFTKADAEGCVRLDSFRKEISESFHAYDNIVWCNGNLCP